MKLLLLYFCLFGAVLAVSWLPHEPEVSSRREEVLKNFINDLTMQIDQLSTTKTEYSETGLINFLWPMEKLVDRMKQLRTEMIQLQVDATMSNATNPLVFRADRDLDLDLVYDKLVKDYNKLIGESLELYTTIRREHSKQLAMSVIAYQKIAQNASLPEASKLIDDVNEILSMEGKLKEKMKDDSTKFSSPEVFAETLEYHRKDLNLLYRKLDKTLVDASAIVSEKTKQFYNSIKAARILVFLLRNVGETKKADFLENALTLTKSSAFEMFMLVPIESEEMVGRIVLLAGVTIRSGMLLETLLESNPTVAVFAETAEAEWIIKSASSLTSMINELSKDTSKYREMNVTYIPSLLSDQVNKMERLRAEIIGFLMKATNFDSKTKFTRDDNLKEHFQRLNNDFELVKRERSEVYNKIQREWRKWRILFVAASQNILFGDFMVWKIPKPDKLIDGVKSFISNENAKNGVVTEIGTLFEDFERDILKITEKRKDRLTAAQRDALSIRAEWVTKEDEDGVLSEWIETMSSYRNMYKHFPIDSSKTADKVVSIVRELINSVKDVEQLKKHIRTYGYLYKKKTNPENDKH